MARFCRRRKPLPGFDLHASLGRLDRDLARAGIAARRLLLCERSGFDGQNPDVLRTRLDDLERGLLSRDFADPDWHGPTSFQRIVWQDAKTLEILAEPDAFTALIRRRDNGSERPIAPGLALSDAVFKGLARNRPSYLVSACPNWRLLPPFGSLANLDDMAVGPDTQREPFIVTGNRLNATYRVGYAPIKALGHIQGPDVSEADEVFGSILDTASSRTLIDALSHLCTQTVAMRLMHDSDNPSTTPLRMNGQCLEVMSHFDNLLRDFNGDHVRVLGLGLGLISHALDAKHLIAVFAEGLGAGEMRYRRVTDDSAISAVRTLFADTATASLGDNAGVLMRARLQQCLHLLWQERKLIGLSESALLSTLSG